VSVQAGTSTRAAWCARGLLVRVQADTSTRAAWCARGSWRERGNTLRQETEGSASRWACGVTHANTTRHILLSRVAAP
jgi:hypothetical protein